MLAVYCEKPNLDDPIAAVVIGDKSEPKIPAGWVRLKMSHASLNRHDIFTLRGITTHPEGIPFPMILGNDGVGTLDDGTPVVIYPVMGSDDWRDDETLDPHWHILGEFVQGTFADYVAVPKRNAIPLPDGMSALHASVLGTAWLTAYRALFTKSGLQAGQTLLVQGASGGMSTALMQLGRAAGYEVWATSRNAKGRAIAEKLGAHRTFDSNEVLPRKVQAVVDNIGTASWAHSLASVARGGTIIATGVTTGSEVTLPLLHLISEQITVCGSIMGTLQDMKDMMNFIVKSQIKPEIGEVIPLERAKEAIRAMWEGNTHGKTVFTR
jgi:NADPH:quinone reductase-like Zn-dependent oxidoreductase